MLHLPKRTLFVVSLPFLCMAVVLSSLFFIPSGAYAQQVTPSPVESDLGQDVFIRTPQVENAQERALKARPRRKANARKVRYQPLANDPRLDPLDENYKAWLESMRGKDFDPKDYDPVYENFVKDVSALMFSLGEKQLSIESREFLKSIPADTLQPLERSLEPKHAVSIDRDEVDDPFPSEKELKKTEDPLVGHDVAMSMTVEAPKNKTQQKLEMGYDALMSGQLTGAIAIYKDVLQTKPKNRQALFGLATAYHRGGQLEEARLAYLDLLAEDPNNWPAMNNFLVLVGEEAPENALKELRKLEQRNPEFSPIPAQMGMIYSQLGRQEEGIKYLSRAVMLSPDNLSYRYNLAVVLDHGGYKTQAGRLYSQLLEANSQGKEIPEPRHKIQDRLAHIRASERM